MFYNIKQFSELINVSKQTLRNWDNNGKLIPIKLKSGHRRYSNEHLKQFNENLKNIDRLEEISNIRNEQRKREYEEEDDDNIKLNISDQDFSLDNLDVHNIEEPKLDLLPDLLIDEIEILE